MTKSQLTKCNVCIHIFAFICGFFGLLPIPVADAIPIVIFQVIMAIILGHVFNHGFTGAAFKGIISATAATFIGRALVQLIPFVGWAVSASVAFVVTETIGWSIAVDMANFSRKEWERQVNAKDAADAYAEAEYYKQVVENRKSEADDFSGE